MGSEIHGQYLVAAEQVFTDWMPRGGDNLSVYAEMIEDLGAEVEIRVYHKDLDDTGPGTRAGAAGTEIILDAVGRHSKEWSGLKELVRIRSKSTGTAGSNALYRILGYTWFDSVDAVTP